MSPKTLKHSDYTIGWICALPKEMTAAIAMLDERHESLPAVSGDDNDYQLGEINGLNIIVACLPIGELGPPSAAKVATRIPFSFPNVKFGLMVGIGGGAPSTTHDVRLGDIVVGIPMDTYGGVIQYDFGKTVQEGKFKRTSMLNSPPDNLLAAVARLKARHDLDGSNVPKYLDEALSKFPRLKSTSSHPGLEADVLYKHNYDHPVGTRDCSSCNGSKAVFRKQRASTEPEIFYGTIASASQVMKDGQTREKLRKEYDVLCFEMEAAGLGSFPNLVIRGICDYADSHKNKRWQEYAAAVAAAVPRKGQIKRRYELKHQVKSPPASRPIKHGQ
ncbi:purine and uridine phosphorylase [Viridothelium virens]|uniref:Purine and uridine phosphorylase n=1 Tax=Viridothelium virens TaxID=1048519 RepID=A0A6A6H016_VIRVR|nr:purine and uridine phosphorylase [Viridothelium virens]